MKGASTVRRGDIGKVLTYKELAGVLPYLQEEPLPAHIAEAIEKAELSGGVDIKFFFKSGLEMLIVNSNVLYLEDLEDIPSERDNEIISNAITKDPKAETVKNKKVLFFAPTSGEDELSNVISVELKKDFENAGFEVTDINISDKVTFPRAWNSSVAKCLINPGEIDNVMRPDDWRDLNLNQYGVIFISAHGVNDENGTRDNKDDDLQYICACPIYYVEDPSDGTLIIDTEIDDFLKYTNTDYYMRYNQKFKVSDFNYPIYYEAIALKQPYIDEFISTQDVSSSLVYCNTCLGWIMHNDPEYALFSRAKVFIGFAGTPLVGHANRWAARYFRYMLGIEDTDFPMSARDAFEKLKVRHKIIKFSNTDIQIDTGDNNENDNTYLPGDVEVIIQKK